MQHLPRQLLVLDVETSGLSANSDQTHQFQTGRRIDRVWRSEARRRLEESMLTTRIDDADGGGEEERENGWRTERERERGGELIQSDNKSDNEGWAVYHNTSMHPYGPVSSGIYL